MRTYVWQTVTWHMTSKYCIRPHVASRVLHGRQNMRWQIATCKKCIEACVEMLNFTKACHTMANRT